jgi:hypothetical protein
MLRLPLSAVYSMIYPPTGGSQRRILPPLRATASVFVGLASFPLTGAKKHSLGRVP